jgi:uncharacterized protein YbaA (DUF1428 family)
MSNGVEHAQIFVYKLPKKNHDAMVKLIKKFTDLYKKYGTLSWEVYQLNSTEAFDGTTSIAKIVSAGPKEEVLIEVDKYKDRKSRDKAIDAIGQDPSAEPLFGEMAGILSPGFSIIMGEYNPVKV